MAKPFKKRKLPKFSNAGMYSGTKYSTDITGNSGTGVKSTNPYEQSAGTSEEGGNGLSSDQYAQAIGAIGTGAAQGYAGYSNPNSNSLQKTRGLQSGVDTAEIGVATAINPILGTAVGAVKKVGSGVQTQVDRTDQNGNIMNRGDSKAGEVVGGFLDPAQSLMAIYSDPKATGAQKIAGALTGGYSDMFTNRHRNQVEASAKADLANQTQQYPMGGNFQQGGNAQLEKQENTLNPDGSTTQFNLPSHEQQSAEEGTVLDPGTLIFSDMLKPKGTKKTFAILNKANNTDKETKTLEDSKSNSLSKKTAQLMLDAKHKNSLKLFQEQETMKQEQAESQAFKDFMACGGMIKYAKGGIHINPANRGKFTAAAKRAGMGVQEYASHVMSHKENFSSTLVKRANFAKNAAGWKHAEGGLVEYPDGGYIPGQGFIPDTNYYGQNARGFNVDKFGRELTQEEQLGFNRPAYDYSGRLAGTTTGLSDYSGSKVNLGIQDPRMGMGNTYNTAPKTWGQNNATVVQNANESFEQAYKRTYGKPLYTRGGIKGKDIKGKDIKGEDEPDIQVPGTQSNNTYLGNPTDNIPMNSWMDKYSQSLSPDQSSQLNNSALNYKLKTQQDKGSNWRDMAYQMGSTLANSAGALTYLGEQGKKYDKQDFYNYTPSLLDPTATLRDIDMQRKSAEYDLRDKSSGNAGNYLTNRSAMASTMALAKDKVQREYQNTNAGISNQGQLANIQGKYMVDDINARNKGQALTNYYKSINSLGTNAAQAGRDYKSSQRDQESMKMMNDLFANYKFNPKTNSWIFKK